MSTFQFQAPLPPPSPTSFSASSDGGIDPDASTDAFYSLLLDCPEMNSSIIESLSNKLLSIRINRSLSVEMKLLESELREEWRIRTGGLKADWMARFVPSHQEDEEEEVEQEEEGGREKEMLQPTIISDVDSRIEMENKVDTLVEKEFNERIEEAQELFINQISSREKLELEIFLGELVSIFILLTDLECLKRRELTINLRVR